MNNILFKVLLLKGENGNSIASIAKTSTSGLVDTYTVTLTDGSTTEFTVTNGKGIVGIAKTGTSGLVDTYTITFNDNTTATFTVTNGANGRGIASIVKTGTSGLVDTYTITYTDNTTSTFTVTNGEDGTGDLTTATQTGNPISITTDIAQVARDTKITFEPIQASGTPTPSNPLPISGYDNVSLDVTEKNIFNGADATLDKFSYSNGTFTNTNTDSKTYFRLSIQVQKLDNSVVALTAVSINTTGTASITFTTPADTKNLLIRHSGTERDFSIVYPFPYTGEFTLSLNVLGCDPTTLGGLSFNNVQVETGSTATTYSPYTPATQITHAFPTTIYGGEVDVERGVLTVTHGIVDMGSLSWVYNSGQDVFWAPLSIKSMGDIKCTVYEGVSTVPNNLEISSRYGYYTENPSVWAKDTDYTEAVTFKNAVAGQKLVYELATPYEIPLTPRLVNLLQGANVITSNGTSIEITYRNGTIATLADVGNLNRTIDALATETAGNKADIATNASDIDTLDGKAVKQTSGVLDAKVNANVTAMATLTTAQLRDIVISDTAPTIGGTSPYPDGTLMLVYS